MTKIITLPNGRPVTIASYCAVWRHIKDMQPGQEVTGWEWFPVAVAEVKRAMSRAVDDRVNIRGGIRTDWPQVTAMRLYRRLARASGGKCACRWCGGWMTYAAPAARFCDPSCRMSHNS